MADRFPLVDQYGPRSTTCPGQGSTGCALGALASVLLMYGKPVPRVGGAVDLIGLGASAGRRHRAENSGIRHGICPSAWCAFCVYLELKARGLPAAYGQLTWAQQQAHVARGHAIVTPIMYSEIPHVSQSSYSSTTPARGRSDDWGGTHMILQAARTGTHILGTDADFGSPARPVIPPHSEWNEDAVHDAWARLGWSVCYLTTAPKGITPVPVPDPTTPGVTYHYGGIPAYRGLYEATADAKQRRSPYIRSDNIIRVVKKGTRFRVRQSTKTGSNVGGSHLWHGDATGRVWMHHSVIRPVK